MKRKNEKKRTPEKTEFSKKLLIQESLLIWVVTLAFIVLAFVCIQNQYFGELPWLAAMAACPWTAYGASQAFYFRKAERENTEGGIKYATVMHDYKTNDDDPPCAPDEIVEDAAG